MTPSPPIEAPLGPGVGPELSAELAAFRHGRVPRELRRRQIVKEAGELFAQRGYEDTSMDELARRVGVSKPVIYSLVGSKEQLFHDVMVGEAEELGGRVARAVSGEVDPERRLRAGALAFFRYVDERRGHWGSIVAADAAPVTREMAAVRRRQAALAARLIAEGAANAGTPIEPRLTDACAHATNGAFEALAAWWQEHDDVAPEALADFAVRLLFPGLLAVSGVELHGRGAVKKR